MRKLVSQWFYRVRLHRGKTLATRAYRTPHVTHTTTTTRHYAGHETTERGVPVERRFRRTWPPPLPRRGDEKTRNVELFRGGKRASEFRAARFISIPIEKKKNKSALILTCVPTTGFSRNPGWKIRATPIQEIVKRNSKIYPQPITNSITVYIYLYRFRWFIYIYILCVCFFFKSSYNKLILFFPVLNVSIQSNREYDKKILRGTGTNG